MLLKRTEKNGVVKAIYESSNILASKYDGKDLTIIFKRGASYTYNDVSKTDYMRFEVAESQGKVLNSNIKSYSFTKNDVVDPTEIEAEINNVKNEEIKAFEDGLVKQMDIISKDYETNSKLDGKLLSNLAEMIIKYNEMSGSEAPLKLCKCD